MSIEIQVVGGLGVPVVRNPVFEDIGTQPNIEIVLTWILAVGREKRFTLSFHKTNERRCAHFEREAVEGPLAKSAAAMAEERVHEVAGAVFHTINDPVIEVRHPYCCVRGAAINGFAGEDLSVAGKIFIGFLLPANEWHEFVFPIDFGKRVAVDLQTHDISIVRMVQEELPIGLVVILVDCQTDLTQV